MIRFLTQRFARAWRAYICAEHVCALPPGRWEPIATDARQVAGGSDHYVCPECSQCYAAEKSAVRSAMPNASETIPIMAVAGADTLFRGDADAARAATTDRPTPQFLKPAA